MLLYGATMFLSALLLFLIQPMIGKYILPWFGGTPAVWTTCMLFFQVLLLGGYGYAHALASRQPPRRQAAIHILLLSAAMLAVLVFSITPSPGWKPADGQSPVLRILGLLLAGIGAPYLVLSATSPLLQSWFGRSSPGSSPYRLYALSNLGSLLAILCYPFLIEPSITLSRQASLWSCGYAAFTLMCIFLALRMLRVLPAGAAGTDAPDAVVEDDPPGRGRYLLWLSLTACSSIMLLASTSMLCQDLAVVPLLWILPLALYLLSFIICFQYERLYWRLLFLPAMAGSIAWSCYILFGSIYVDPRWQLVSYSLTLFASCMVCHGELVRLKPGFKHLTSFYLMVAGGGALGALLVTVGAPHLLKGFWEYHFGLLATALVALIVLFIDRKGPLYQGRPLHVWLIWALICFGWAGLLALLVENLHKSWRFYVGLLSLALLTLSAVLHDRRGPMYAGRPARVWTVWVGLLLSWVALGAVLGYHIRQSLADSVEARRNFFGVMRVLELNKDDESEHRLTLMHGRIEHGYQFLDKGKSYAPTSYYGPESGLGLAIRLHPRRAAGQALRIGVIGLGTGTIAAYGRPGDVIRFYEINPEVLKLSDKYFTYRKDSQAHIQVVLGDARVSMERERQRGESQQLDILAVDAFSSDAIPVHLLTRECFQAYRYHLKADGILAVHVSNRYFDLKPVVRNLFLPDPQKHFQALWISGTADAARGTYGTDWVLVTTNQDFVADPEVQKGVTAWGEPAPPPKFWTDDYSNLFGLLIKN